MREAGADRARRRRRSARATASTSPPWTETTTGAPGARAADRVARRRGVVGVDEVERERAPQPAQRERAASAPPTRPSDAVAARARRGEERHVVDARARRARRAAAGAAARAARAGRARAARRATGPGGAARARARRRRRRARRAPGGAPRRRARGRPRAGSTRRRRRRARLTAPARRQRLGRPASRVDVRAAGEEARRPRPRRPRAGRSRRSGAGGGPAWRRRSPSGEPGRGRRGRPVGVEAPAHREVRERQQHRRTRRRGSRSPGRSRRSACGGRARPGRRRVTGQAACEANACAGWASARPKRSATQQERVEEAGGQHDVVVDDQQPVGVVRAGARRAPRGGSPTCRAPGAPGASVQRDVVARAPQLGRDRAVTARELRAGDAGDEARAGAAARSRRGAAERARRCGAVERVRGEVARAAGEQRRGGRACPDVARQVRPVDGVAAAARPRRPGRGPRRLGASASRSRPAVCGGQHDPVAAAVAAGVPDAAGERAQLAGERRRGALRLVEAARVAAAVPAPRARARGCARPRPCGGGRRPPPRRSGSARPPRAAGAPTPPRRRVRSARGRTGRRARAPRGARARFAPQTSSASRSVGPRSSVVTGAARGRRRAGSCPRAARGSGRRTPRARGARPPRRAARRASRARRRRRRRGSRAGRPPRGLDRRVAGDVEPARRAERDVARAVRRARARSVAGSAGSSSTTTISAPCAAAWPAHGGERDREVVAPAAGREEDRGGGCHGAEEVRRLGFRR